MRVASIASISPLLDIFPSPNFLAMLDEPPVEPIPNSSKRTNIAGNRINALAAAIHNRIMMTVINGLISGIGI